MQQSKFGLPVTATGSTPFTICYIYILYIYIYIYILYILPYVCAFVHRCACTYTDSAGNTATCFNYAALSCTVRQLNLFYVTVLVLHTTTTTATSSSTILFHKYMLAFTMPSAVIGSLYYHVVGCKTMSFMTKHNVHSTNDNRNESKEE